MKVSSSRNNDDDDDDDDVARKRATRSTNLIFRLFHRRITVVHKGSVPRGNYQTELGARVEKQLILAVINY